MRVCDVTQFHSPVGGGVKRYLEEKRAYVADRPGLEHVLVIPGARTAVERPHPRLTTVTIRSPLLSATSRYRLLLDLPAVRRAVFAARPDVVEVGDPYHVAWAAIEAARDVGAGVTGFYHSHFPDAYLRTVTKYAGRVARRLILAQCQRYLRDLYNRVDRTLVASARLRPLLTSWGVRTVAEVRLGVDTTVFTPGPRDEGIRAGLGLRPETRLLLYAGRLAGEKNTPLLLAAIDHLAEAPDAGDWAWLILGQGPYGPALAARRAAGRAVHWIPYVEGKAELARHFRAADLCVHPCLNETFGLVPLEEQACGRVVAGIRGSGLDDLIFAGLEDWAEAATPEALVGAIRRLAARDRGSLGQAAAARVARDFAWPVVLDHLFKLYREVSGQRGREAGPACLP